MKKIYNSPSTIVVAVKTQKHMLFGSPDGGNTLNGGGNKGDYSANQASRKSSIWDDEDE